jgi:zinc/manganese transport system permease protein
MLFDSDIFNILAPAFFAGAMIALVHVPFGIEVLNRGIIFLDLAIAQFAALGMLAFHVYFDNEALDPRYAAVGTLGLGLSFALLCALAFHKLEKYSGRYQEALIGSAFILAASMGIIIMAGDPHSGEQMKDVLAGQILWITWKDLTLFAPVFIVVALIWSRFKEHRARLFYVLFALTIPFSVSLIGVYLVFASLILPALATIACHSFRTFKAIMISMLSFALGLLMSYFYDAPSGPMIVMSMFVVSTSYYFFSAKK